MKLQRSFVVLMLLFPVAAFVPLFGSPYFVSVCLTLSMWIALAESWVLFSGLTGYISLGHVVFYGLGSYAAALLWGSIPVPVILVCAGVAASGFAIVAGYIALKVRGPYFVMVSFGLAEFVKYLVIYIDAARGQFSRLILGGPSLSSIYYIMLGLAAVSALVVYFVGQSRFGYALRAIRESEETAETIGIPIARYKFIAFAASAFIPGAVGALMALRSAYFEPTPAFDPVISFTIVTIAIIGGSDEVRGPFFGALFLVSLSQLLWAHAPNIYIILLGLLLICFVLFIPQGLVGQLSINEKRRLDGVTRA